jgi:CBS domain containing-hemolysin-like protein
MVLRGLFTNFGLSRDIQIFSLCDSFFIESSFVMALIELITPSPIQYPEKKVKFGLFFLSILFFSFWFFYDLPWWLTILFKIIF